mmetsp:Transcript_41202/g.64377  ORF Transcript_41202/g.64377 Transcript_41202/m.64377 type:complete len:683 (-) Transcript_41202:757-2805(-)|eukprot:CAMPEP_0184314828 /NCGR_PEP_ID=MMETSP1049-20130417/77437_1 /TAXON_ID=77928 /ORGANISM="Proteomonas sulcata, Strain CCMP704" /LENGTH=682 /DNA_ID=CAMNT_0026632967 /DNA_START=45 /DNA_END=2093 /DNA_ORIENTATION=+
MGDFQGIETGASAQLTNYSRSRDASLAKAERTLEAAGELAELDIQDGDQVSLSDLVSPPRPVGAQTVVEEEEDDGADQLTELESDLKNPQPPGPSNPTPQPPGPGPIVPHKKALPAQPPSEVKEEPEAPPTIVDPQRALMDHWKTRADSFRADLEIPTDRPVFTPALLEVLRAHPSKRPKDKIEEAAAQIRRLPFWDTLSPAEQTQDVWTPLLQHSELLENFVENTLLLNQDNAMEALFVVLVGGVTAMIHTQVKQFTTGSSAAQSVANVEQTYRFIAPGESFGSLMVGKLKAAPNAASSHGNRDVKSITIARPDTIVLRLDPYRVEKVFEGVMEQHLLQRAIWLQGTKLFEMWDFEDLKDIAGLMQTRRFTSNQLICKQGEPATELYIVTQGSCRVVREIVAPYTLVKGGYNRTPTDVLEHISTPMVSALNRLAQGSLTVKKDLQETARCASMLYSVDMPHEGKGKNVDHSAIRKKILEAESKEVVSNRGTFVGSLSRINEQKKKVQDAAARHKAKKLQKEQGVNEGKAKAFEKSTRSLIVEIRKLWRGSFFGELSLINKEPKTASVIASTAVEVLSLSKMDFFRHFDEKMVSWIRQLGQVAGYTTDDKVLSDSLALESTWTDYKQSLVSDRVYGARHSDVYTKDLVRDMLRDPTTLSTVTRKREPFRKLTSLQIRRVDDR